MVASRAYAGFWLRLVAAIIDMVVLGMAIGILGKGIPFLGRQLSALAGALYSILLWVNWNGQTVGKKAMKIKVIREDGKPLDYQTAIFRYLGYIVSGVVLCLGFLWVAWDGKKQGWHDKIAKTLVVKE